HYQFDNQDGLSAGKELGVQVAGNFLLPMGGQPLTRLQTAVALGPQGTFEEVMRLVDAASETLGVQQQPGTAGCVGKASDPGPLALSAVQEMVVRGRVALGDGAPEPLRATIALRLRGSAGSAATIRWHGEVEIFDGLHPGSALEPKVA